MKLNDVYIFLECGRPKNDAPRSVQRHRTTIEYEFVLTTDHIDVDQRNTVLTHALTEHGLAP